jgi:hypothetical protein
MSRPVNVTYNGKDFTYYQVGDQFYRVHKETGTRQILRKDWWEPLKGVDELFREAIDDDGY